MFDILIIGFYVTFGFLVFVVVLLLVVGFLFFVPLLDKHIGGGEEDEGFQKKL